MYAAHMQYGCIVCAARVQRICTVCAARKQIYVQHTSNISVRVPLSFERGKLVANGAEHRF